MLDLLTRVLARSWLHLMSAPMETVTRTITGGLCRASLFDGANQDHDYYLAHAASLRCLETCFPKETTEGQLLSAELFSLLSMCVLAACLWPTDPEQQHEMGPRASPTPHPQHPPSLRHPNMHFADVWIWTYKTLIYTLVSPLARQKKKKRETMQEVVWM